MVILKKQERVIPKKNYMYLLIMLICVVFSTFFIFEISKDIQNKKLETSNFDGFLSEVKLEEIDSILTEPSSDLFIIVTRVNDEKVYKVESSIKKVIKNYDMRDNFLFIDYTDEEIDVLNKKFGSNIKSIPAIIYYRNGEFVKSIDSSEDMITSGDVEQIIEEYEIN